jgi:DNA-binding response OmpR family regulator
MSRNEIESALSQAGYDILVAENVERAVTVASAFLPDLLIVHYHKTDDKSVLDFVEAVQKGNSPIPETTTLIIEEIDISLEAWSQPILERITTALSDHITE